MTKINEKERELLEALRDQGPMTADDYVSEDTDGRYVNTWAPLFTGLRKKGRDLVARTGQRRLTTHGRMANVIEITPAGRAALEES